jgi:uncharacterized protein YbjT (DUF2867 family)
MTATQTSHDVWLNPREAGAEWGLTPGFVKRLIVNGLLPAARPNGHHLYVRRSDLAELMAASLTPATQGPLAK